MDRARTRTVPGAERRKPGTRDGRRRSAGAPWRGKLLVAGAALALAMTAPGLPSVLAVPETTDRLPMPVLPTDRIPVNFPVQPWETVPGGGGFEPDAWQMTSTSQDHRGHHPHQRSSSPN